MYIYIYINIYIYIYEGRNLFGNKLAPLGFRDLLYMYRVLWKTVGCHKVHIATYRFQQGLI